MFGANVSSPIEKCQYSSPLSVITVYVKRGVILFRYHGVVLATLHTVVDENGCQSTEGEIANKMRK